MMKCSRLKYAWVAIVSVGHTVCRRFGPLCPPDLLSLPQCIPLSHFSDVRFGFSVPQVRFGEEGKNVVERKREPCALSRSSSYYSTSCSAGCVFSPTASSLWPVAADSGADARRRRSTRYGNTASTRRWTVRPFSVEGNSTGAPRNWWLAFIV